MVYGLPRVGCSLEYDTLDDLAWHSRVGPTLTRLLGGEMASFHVCHFEKLLFAGRIVFVAIEIEIAVAPVVVVVVVVVVAVLVAAVVFVDIYLKQTFVPPPFSFPMRRVHLTSLKH